MSSSHESPRASRSVPLFLRVLLAALLGAGTGALLGTGGIAGVTTADLGELGMLVIRALKALATPLIFLAVVDGLMRFEVPRKKGLALLLVSGVNAMVAIAIGLGVAHALGLGEGAFDALADTTTTTTTTTAATHGASAHASALSPFAAVDSFIPESVVAPFAKNAIISVVLGAVLLGVALRSLRRDSSEAVLRGTALIGDVVHALLAALVKVLGWIVALVPIAVFCVVASVVGKTGWSVFGGLLTFLFTMLLGLFLHAVVYYSFVVAVVARRSPLGFFRGALDAITTALSCGSSLATLPITLRCLDNMRVSPSSARLATCVGTNLNHDGIILYEAAAAIFVAQAFAVHLDGSQQIAIAFAAVLAGIGIAGIPEAGLVTLPLVLGAAGLPAPVVATVVPTLLPVDWIIGRCRATTNVLSDMTVATVLDRVASDDGNDDRGESDHAAC